MGTRKSQRNCGQLSVTYTGPDPARVTLCQCYNCQRRTGSAFSVQARLPIEYATVEGRSNTWSFPEPGKTADFRSCDSIGCDFHFCPECGSTVYWDIPSVPEFLGVAVGCFTDPEFPPPVIAGFEAYGAKWALNVSELGIPHHQYDGSGATGKRL